MASTSFLIDEFTGSDAQVQVTLTDVGTDTVQVKLEVVSGYIADITGFFVNFQGLSVNNNFTVTPVSATPGTLGTGTLFLDDSGSTTDNIEPIDSNVNLNGQGVQREFDLAVQIGEGGLKGGSDDFRTVVFNLSAAGLDVSDFSKVGVRLQSVGANREGSSKLEGEVPPPITANPAIDVEKLVSVDGGATWVDADSITGPFLLTGNNPQFKFVVTNTGNVDLSNVTLSDSDFNLDGLVGDLNSGNSTYDIGTLAAGASQEVFFTGATWHRGQHTNTATASGSYNGSIKTDTDDANYFGADPSIDVEKYVSVDGGTTWVDADSATGPFLLTGNNPQFKFVVTNTGNVDLSNVSLSDSDFNLDGLAGDVTSGNSTYDIGTLAAGGFKEVIFTDATWQKGQHTNTATAEGSFTDGGDRTSTKTDTDDASYFGAAPGIDVEKYVSVDGGATWVDADSATGPLAIDPQYGGLNPQFKFVVQNTGNVALSNITLSDDRFDLNGAAAGTSISIASLAADDGAAGGADEYSYIFTGTTWQAGQHTNTATVSTAYTDGGGNVANLTDSDTANYFGVSGPGVGTPGFWQRWTDVWDGDTRNDSNFNTRANFAKADILYQVADPVTGQATTPTNATASTNRGILIGDFNRDGLTNPGENTIYYSVAEARAILNSSASNDGQDARYIMGKQLVASWLNVLAGNTYSHVEQDIKNAVVWMQNATPNEGGTSAGDGNLTLNTTTFRLPSSNVRWSTALGSVSGTKQHYGVQVKDVLDYYNNTGAGLAIDRDTGAVGGSTSQLSSLQTYQPSF